MTHKRLNYEYRKNKLSGGSEKYGACEITGEKYAEMFRVTKHLRYLREDGTEGKSFVSDLFCSEEGASRYLATAETGDCLESAMAETCSAHNLESPSWAK